MKVKLKKTVNIRDQQPYEVGKEYEVDEGLGRWMLDKDVAEEVAPIKPSAVPKDASYLPVFERLMDLTEGHLAEIYGPYDSGKSRLVHAIAVEAEAVGKRVVFIDTEGGLVDEHIRQLKKYLYVGDSIEALEDVVAWAKKNRNDYDILIVDSVGHPVYVNYVELESMAEKLRTYQRLALIFRDMVRFARGEKDVDLGKRRSLAIATNHTVSEFARSSKDLLPEEPLSPFGGQIHRVPKVILRSEPVEHTKDKSVFRLLSFKVRNLAKDIEVARFTINEKGVKIEWKV